MSAPESSKENDEKIGIDLEEGGLQNDQVEGKGPKLKKVLLITTATVLFLAIIVVIGLAAAGAFSKNEIDKKKAIPNEKLVAAADTIDCDVIEGTVLQLEPATVISMPPITSIEVSTFARDKASSEFLNLYPCYPDGSINLQRPLPKGFCSTPGGPGVQIFTFLAANSRNGICGIGSATDHSLQLRSLKATCDPSKTKKCTAGFNFPKFTVASGIPSPLVVNGTAQVQMNSCKKVKVMNGNIEIPVTGRNAPTQTVDLVRFHLNGVIPPETKSIMFNILPFQNEIQFVVEDSIGSGSAYTVKGNSKKIKLPVNEKQTLLVGVVTNQDVLNSTTLRLSQFEIAT